MDGSGAQPTLQTTAWLGAGTVAPKDQRFLPFKKALRHARSLKLKNLNEWQAWCKSGKRPRYIPSAPNATYKHEGWQGFGHWLGTGNLASRQLTFLPFKKALVYARSLKLKGLKEWKDWAKTSFRPANMPSTPDRTYKHDGWQGYGHWLGTGAVAPKDQQFLPFEKALVYACSLKLKGQKEWETWCKSGVREGNVPSNPQRTYKHDGWQGYGHWLGTGAVAHKDKQFLPFKKALLYARSLKLKTQNEWYAWRKSDARPASVPSSPEQVYRHGSWKGYGHWLGTGTVAPKD